MAGIGFFHDDHARVLPQFPCELPLPYIHGEDPGGPVLQQAVREAAGGRAQIERDQPGHVESKMDQGVFQLVPAAADVFFPGIEGERVGGFDRVAGLACGLKVDADLAGEDKAFGLFAAFTKAAFNQGMVESDHGWYRRTPEATVGWRCCKHASAPRGSC
jgi:hypothetical protein